MKVLIACEFSGVVREAFSAFSGVQAVSCDLLPCEDGRVDCHRQCDVREILYQGWDLMIAHPPCTYLNSAGLHWIARGRIESDGRARADHQKEALDFVRELLDAPIGHIALENPIGCISSKIRKPSQIIQPYQFGEDASKATCVWLKNLPLLIPTNQVSPRIINGRPRWSNQTDSGQNKLTPSADRWAFRSITYPVIAAAMAEQWISAVLKT